MIVPFLDCNCVYNTYGSDPLDPATSIQNAIRTNLLLVGWTEPAPGGTFYSPVRTDGVQMSIKVNHVSGSQVSYEVFDHLGRRVNPDTNNRTCQNITATINPPGTRFNIYAGARYLLVEVDASSGGSIWYAAILNKEPDPIDQPFPVYLSSYGPVRGDGSTAASSWGQVWVALNGPGTSYIDNLVCWNGLSASGQDHFSAQGSMMFVPTEFGASSGYFFGRLPNMLLVCATQSAGVTFTVPLDDSHTGTFRVLRGTSSVPLGAWGLAARMT